MLVSESLIVVLELLAGSSSLDKYEMIETADGLRVSTGGP